MSAKHTPGPWWPTDSGVRDRGGYIAHTNSVQRYEGQDERYSREVEQRAADKLLIAAAPELLEALIELADCGAEAWGEDRPCVRIARDAIAKATGGKA